MCCAGQISEYHIKLPSSPDQANATHKNCIGFTSLHEAKAPTKHLLRVNGQCEKRKTQTAMQTRKKEIGRTKQNLFVDQPVRLIPACFIYLYRSVSQNVKMIMGEYWLI